MADRRDGAPLSDACVSATERIDCDDVAGQWYAGLGSDQSPGVVVLHGSGGPGGYEREYARLLSEHGYATCCVEYFDAPGTPAALDRVPLDIVECAIEWLRERPGVAEDRVGLVGFSRGGEAALLTGVRADAVGAVVAYSASGYAFPAPTWMDGVDEERAAWIADDEPVPYIPVDRHVEHEQNALADDLDLDEPISTRAVERADPDTRRRAEIPVERIDGPVLFVTGGEDAIWPAPALADVAIDRLDAHDHPWPYENRVYPDAGHAIRVPYQFDGSDDPTADHRLGGTLGANARASADAWLATLECLDRGLRTRAID